MKEMKLPNPTVKDLEDALSHAPQDSKVKIATLGGIKVSIKEIEVDGNTKTIVRLNGYVPEVDEAVARVWEDFTAKKD